MVQIQTQLKEYYDKNNIYPDSLNELESKLPSIFVDPSTNQPYFFPDPN